MNFPLVVLFFCGESEAALFLIVATTSECNAVFPLQAVVTKAITVLYALMPKCGYPVKSEEDAREKNLYCLHKSLRIKAAYCVNSSLEVTFYVLINKIY